MWIQNSDSETARVGVEQSKERKPLDFSQLVADSHLTQKEQRIVSEAFETDKDALLSATKWKLRDFIRKDYESANMQTLGGFEGILQLQKALGMKAEDITGSFGPTTFQALIEYQKSNGLKTDAIAGPETMAKLGLSKVEVGQMELGKKNANRPSRTNSQETASHNDARPQKPAWVQEHTEAQQQQQQPAPAPLRTTEQAPESAKQKPTDADTQKPAVSAAPVQDTAPKNHDDPKKQKQIPEQLLTTETQAVSAAPTIRKLSQTITSLEKQIETINHTRKENTGIVGGMGDMLIQGVNNISGSENETGKQIYERQLRSIQDQAKDLHSKVLAEFAGKNLSASEKTEVDALVVRLEKASGAKLAEVSWGKAVFNSIGVGDIRWNEWSHESVAKKDAKNIIGLAEGLYTVVSGTLEITGKAIGIASAYVASAVSEGKFDSSVGKQIAKDVGDIFSKLTMENAKKALDLLPNALNDFANASPDEKAEGFGKFFGATFIPAGVAYKVLRPAETIAKSWSATEKVAEAGAKVVQKQKEVANTLPLAKAWVVQSPAWTATAGGGSALRVGEMDAGWPKRQKVTKAKEVMTNNKDGIDNQHVENKLSEIEILMRNAGIELPSQSPKGPLGEGHNMREGELSLKNTSWRTDSIPNRNELETTPSSSETVNIKDTFFRQFDTIAKIQNTLVSVIKDPKNRSLLTELSTQNFVQKIVRENVWDAFQTLPSGQQKTLLKTLEWLVKQTQKIQKVLSDPKYRNNQRQLVADIFKVDVRSIKGNVSVMMDPPSVSVFVDDTTDFYLLVNFGNRKKALDMIRNAPMDWWALPKGYGIGIPELDGSLSIIRDRSWGHGGDGVEIQAHERQHNLNRHIIREASSLGFLRGDVQAKDEILAYMKGGRNTDEIKHQLIDENGAYNYQRRIPLPKPLYKKLWSEHVQKVSEAVDVAERFRTMNIPHYLDILAITPIEHWPEIEKIYSGTATMEEKMKLHIQLLKTHKLLEAEDIRTGLKWIIALLSLNLAYDYYSAEDS